MKLPSSYDIIGHILLLSEKTKVNKSILDALLRRHKQVKTIAIKTGIHSGRYRTQKVIILKGKGKRTKETIHKENNVQVKLNIETCYFSPRLSNERLRIAKKVRDQESILVCFSGVSIYPLVIEKNSNPKEIYAIELNPKAHKYALENLKLNNSRKIKLFKGDVKKVLPKIKKKFDRIIMPLPFGAEAYLDLAKEYIKPKGIIHFYDVQEESNIPEASIEKIRNHIKDFKILTIRKCGKYSPRKYRTCLDIKVN